jgi:hypothetical protein
VERVETENVSKLLLQSKCFSLDLGSGGLVVVGPEVEDAGDWKSKFPLRIVMPWVE